MMKKEQHMKINSEAKRLAALVFAEKEVADQKAKLEELCNTYEATIVELSDKEKAAKDGNTDLSEKLETLKTQKVEMEDKLKVSETEKAELTKKLDEYEKKMKALEDTLGKLENEAKLQGRTKSCEEAGILSKGKAAERQLKRIASMDDEAFAEWLDEQKALKAEWLEEHAKTAPKDKDKKSADEGKEEAKGKGKDKEEDADEEDDDEEDFDDTVKNMSRAELIKAMRASAGLNLTSKKKGASDDLDPEFTKKLSSMWDEDEKKDRS